MRLVDADKYMNHLRANIDTTSNVIAEQIKKDKPIGTVADGGQIGYLNALQWARASLECDCYTVNAIPLDKVKQAISEVSNLRLESGIKGNIIDDEIYIDSMVVLKILDNLIESEG